MTVLDEILDTKRDEVTMLHRPEVRDLLRTRALEAPATRDFTAALRPAPPVDPGAADTHTATVTWGDGSVDGPVAVSGGTVAATHTYATAGTFVRIVPPSGPRAKNDWP